jgi:hypothetical protein
MTDPLVQLFQANRAPGKGCAAPEEIWQAVGGLAGKRRTAELVEHTLGCGDCARLWRLAREAHAAGEEPAQVVPLARRGRWLGWAALGGAGLAAAAAMLLVLRRPVVENPERGSPEGRIVSTTARELPREAFLLRWAPAGAGAVYRIQVSLANLSEIDSAAELTTNERLVPQTALERVGSGTDVLWKVEARLPDGRTVTSPTFRTRVR